jgi:Ca-activated chloride channel family protein
MSTTAGLAKPQEGSTDAYNAALNVLRFSTIAPDDTSMRAGFSNIQMDSPDFIRRDADSGKRDNIDQSTSGQAGTGAATTGPDADALRKQLRQRAISQSRGAVAPTPVTLPRLSGMLPGVGEEIWIIERPSQTDAPAMDDALSGQLGAGEIRVGAPGTGVLTPTSIDVSARIDGYIAQVMYRQTFKPSSESAAPGVYLINLPPDASVTEFVMTLGDRKIRAVICDRAEAARLFERATASGHRATITSVVEGNRFAARFADVGAGANAKELGIEMTYFHVLPYEGGEFTLRVPLRVGIAPGSPGEPVRLSVGVQLNGAVPIEDVRSSTHTIRVDRPALGGGGGGGASGPENPLARTRASVYLTGALDAGQSAVGRDFVLHYRLSGDDPRPGMLTYTDAKGDTYFAVFLVPPRVKASGGATTPAVRHPIEWVLVVDRSSAVSSDDLALTGAIIREFLAQVDPRDFVRVQYSDGASIPLDAQGGAESAGTLLPADRARAAMTSAALTPLGADVLAPALRRAMGATGSPQLQRVTVLISPGRFSDSQDVLADVGANLKFNRLATISVGPGADRAALLAISRYGKGAAMRVDRVDDVEFVVRSFIKGQSTAPLIDISLGFNDTQGQDVVPRRVPDVLMERPSMLLGRWVGKAPSVLSVSARAGPDVKFMLMNPGVTDQRAGSPALAQVWARLQLSDMATWATSATLPTFELDARALSAEFGVPSPWTALLAIDATPR